MSDHDARDRFFQVWSSVSGPTWDSSNVGQFLPSDLTSDERHVAKGELRAIPEKFYSRFQLPVITPSNVDEFVAVVTHYFGIAVPQLKVMLWTWFSGSSNLAATMSSSPFFCVCLFPVDLRYGWNIADRKTQKLLSDLDGMFKPLVTTMEPRCKFWSISGSRRSPSDTSRLRNLEGPMLSFVASHVSKIHHDSRLWWNENPKTSAIWSESPLVKHDNLKYENEEDKALCNRITTMCGHSPLPDGQRSLKLTI